jgi:hypothetical protein
MPAWRWCSAAIARYSVAVIIVSSHASSIRPAGAGAIGVGRLNGSHEFKFWNGKPERFGLAFRAGPVCAFTQIKSSPQGGFRSAHALVQSGKHARTTRLCEWTSHLLKRRVGVVARRRSAAHARSCIYRSRLLRFGGPMPDFASSTPRPSQCTRRSFIG